MLFADVEVNVLLQEARALTKVLGGQATIE
jgi:hypothetical protein